MKKSLIQNTMCQVLDIRATLPFLTGMKLSLPTTIDRYLYKIFIESNKVKNQLIHSPAILRKYVHFLLQQTHYKKS
jgi:hypothetical protein